MFGFLYTNLHSNTYFYQSMNMRAESVKKKYFLEANAGTNYRHGGIGGVDIETVLRNNGFNAVRFAEGIFPFVQPLRWMQMQRFLRQLQEGDLLVALFPVYPRLYQRLLHLAAKKKINLVIILMDIDGLKNGDPQLLEKEIRFLQPFSQFIVHGETMAQWLQSKLPHAVCSLLGPFDFLAAKSMASRLPAPAINYAGNLLKSRFIYQLNQVDGVQFLLYGEGGEKAANNHQVIWKGVFQPHALPAIAEGSFGLVWDGDAIDRPAGVFGHYMQYIFHHKLSMYILAGLPVFINSQAGAADYVVREGLGWKIDAIQELPAKMAEIGPEAYQLAREKMAVVATQLNEGQHILHALRKFSS